MSGTLSRRSALVGLTATVLGCHGKRTASDAARRAPAADDSTPLAKVIRTIESRPAIDGAGATVSRIFPSPQLRDFDPFVLLDDFNVRVPAGFPDHPHRGFEAFTYMIEGAFEHKDNLGNTSRVTAGGVQRFNSGRGARHSEMPGTEGNNRGLQLWVNLPRKLKQMDPEYQGVQADVMPVSEESTQTVHTVVGSGSPVALHTDVDYLDVRLLEGVSFEHHIAPGRNTLLYALDGGVRVDGTTVPRGSGVLLSDGRLVAHGERGSRFALLSGRPHGEPIVHRGPFVD